MLPDCNRSMREAAYCAGSWSFAHTPNDEATSPSHHQRTSVQRLRLHSAFRGGILTTMPYYWTRPRALDQLAYQAAPLQLGIPLLCRFCSLKRVTCSLMLCSTFFLDSLNHFGTGFCLQQSAAFIPRYLQPNTDHTCANRNTSANLLVLLRRSLSSTTKPARAVASPTSSLASLVSLQRRPRNSMECSSTSDQ